jgi:hypothetical protein
VKQRRVGRCSIEVCSGHLADKRSAAVPVLVIDAELNSAMVSVLILLDA